MFRAVRNQTGTVVWGLAVTLGLLSASSVLAASGRVSKPFTGVKVNGGTVTMTIEGSRIRLTLSDDFVDPKTPDPHWQVVDKKGNVYLLEKLSIKNDKFNKSILLPAYIRDVSKVQIWCAFAETLLGETSFEAMASAASGELYVENRTGSGCASTAVL
jgi:hypothetical protein